MTTIRWASFLLAALSLACLMVTPVSPASVLLAGFFITSFTVCAWTYRERRNSDAEN